MSQNKDTKQNMNEETTVETYSVWTQPAEKWSNPLAGRGVSFSKDLSKLKDSLDALKPKLKPFETPVSIESLNYIVN